MSDFSLGLYKYDYEGIQGASEYSAGWKQRFEAIVAKRQEAFDKLTDWDQALYEKTMHYVLGADIHYVSHTYPEVGGGKFETPVSSTTPPATDLNTVATREEEWIARYNEKYAK